MGYSDSRRYASSMYVDFEEIWSGHLPLIEFSYNNVPGPISVWHHVRPCIAGRVDLLMLAGGGGKKHSGIRTNLRDH